MQEQTEEIHKHKQTEAMLQ